jgi:hypothetical protein
LGLGQTQPKKRKYPDGKTTGKITKKGSGVKVLKQIVQMAE